MSEGREEFAAQLRAAGIEPASVDASAPARVLFPFPITVGRFAGTTVQMGLTVPPDFDRSPPSGPHVSPPLIRQHGGGLGNVGGSDFGADFEYWSRPYTNWGRDGRTVAAYLAFLRMLFAET